MKKNIYLAAVIVIFGVVAFWLVWRVNAIENYLSQLAADTKSASQQNPPKGAQTTANNAKEVENGRYIIITDAGFLTKNFEVSPGDKIKLSISNQGAAAHSFTIDSLGIKTGPIEPGKTVTTDSLKMPADGTLEYYSDTAGDSKNEAFKGSIAIIGN